MGAMAFLFFAEYDLNTREKWILSNELYEVVKKAISEQRNERQQSISDLITEWDAAK